MPGKTVFTRAGLKELWQIGLDQRRYGTGHTKRAVAHRDGLKELWHMPD